MILSENVDELNKTLNNESTNKNSSNETINSEQTKSSFLTPQRQTSKSDLLRRASWTTTAANDNLGNQSLNINSATYTFPSTTVHQQTAQNGGHILASHYSIVGVNLLHTTLTNISQNKTQKISAKTMKCWSTAKSRSFYARDNVANFLKWCRSLGVREAVLFETEDLVSQRCAKNVILCLLEVARIACSLLNFSPCPGLVQLEHEIDLLEQQEKEQEENLKNQNHTITNFDASKEDKQFDNEMQKLFNQLNVHPIQHDTVDAQNSSVYHLNQDIRKAEICLVNNELENQLSSNLVNLNNHTNNCSNDPSINSGDELSSCDLQSYVNRSNNLNQISRSCSSISAGSTTESTKYSENSQIVSQLDQKVMLIAKNYYGKKAKNGIQRIAEGKYRIAGKIVFVRLLSQKHVMVRVGGGWTTLRDFLERHGSDSSSAQICVADLLPMDTRPEICTSRKKLQNSLYSINTQQLLQVPQSNQLTKLPNGSKSNNEISNRANQLNYNLSNTNGLRRCLSSTPVCLSSPEPVSSGYCSSTTSNSAISNQNIVEQKLVGNKQMNLDKKTDSNTSLNSLNCCDKISRTDSKIITKQNDTTIDKKIELNKQIDKNDKIIKYSTPVNSISLIKRPRSSILKKSDNQIEKSSIPICSTNHLTNQTPINRINQQQNRNIKSATDKINRNAFGFQTTASKSNKLQSIDKQKLKSTSGQHLNSLANKRNLATSLNSLPTIKSSIPVKQTHQISSLRKPSTNLINNNNQINRMNCKRSNSIQNVNVQSSNFGFNNNSTSIKSTKLTNRSKQYNSSTSLNNMPITRSKICSRLNFDSAKTRSTTNLDNCN